MKEVLERGGEGVGQIQFRNSFSFDTFPSFVDCFLSNLGAKVDLISANLMLHSGVKSEKSAIWGNHNEIAFKGLNLHL